MKALGMLKLPLHIQEAMVENQPDVFSLPPGGWAKHGWTYADTDKIDLDLLRDLLDLAWRQVVAPKKLAAAYAAPSREDLNGRRPRNAPAGACRHRRRSAQAPRARRCACRGPRKAAVLFIFFTALMDVIALGIMIPVLPNLIKQFAGGDTALAAQYALGFAVTWGVMQFFCGPIMGMLSDRFGRRPVLLISIFGLGVDYLFMALAPTLAWLFVGRVINGVTSASFSTANAYVADITPPKDRAKAFGMMGAAFGVGFIVGPAIGGALGSINLRFPFYLSAGLALATGSTASSCCRSPCRRSCAPPR